MNNADIAIAEQYWEDTLLTPETLLAAGVGQEGSPDEPPKFKSYPGQRAVPLPQRLPHRLGPVTRAFTSGPSRPLTRDTLGALLYYSYGFSRIDVGVLPGWPYHRTVASARCFYPTELYLCLPGGGFGDAGVYHYDQLHHALVPLRAGDFVPLVAAAAHADLSGTPAVLVLTSHYWKTAFRYRHYAYRLCTQEAGMVAGNVLMVASALGLTGHVHYEFVDEAVDRLLGLTPGEERTMAVIPLYQADAAPTAPRAGGSHASAAEIIAEIAPISVPFREVPRDLSLARRVYEMDASSVLADTREFTAIDPAVPGEPRPAVGGDHTPLPEPDGETDLTTALRARTSGGLNFRPVPGPVPAQPLAALARWTGCRYPSDVPGTPLAGLHLIVQDVAGIGSGVYRCADRGLVRTGALPPGRLDRALEIAPVADVANANVLCYILGVRGIAMRLGNRGYRIASMDAGVMAQRVSLLAAAGGLASRPVNGYSARGVQQLLGVDPEQLPLFQIILGRRPATAQYELPIIF
jgi:SagB-type dehydrogenase family enzyme